MPEPKRRTWSREQDKLLGRAKDREVGRIVGRNPSNVSARRRALGISVFNLKPELAPRRRGARWTEKEKRLVGTLPDGMLARRFQRTFYGIRVRRRLKHRKPRLPRAWTRKEEARLGTTSDAELARLFLRDEADVAARRRELGIPVFPLRWRWTAEEEAILGTMSDRKVALLLRRSRSATR